MVSFAGIMMTITKLETDRAHIREMADIREEENDAFRVFIKNSDAAEIDCLVHQINAVVEAAIDCTECGACCKTLMINVEPPEAEKLATCLNMGQAEFKQLYIEESLQGHLVINQMPCHFLADTRCSVYEDRFSECREFPHLHKKDFRNRMFGTLMHYAMCPIIFNVVEELKIRTGFKETLDV